MLSFWEKESFLAYDFIVVGGGIIGLSTALSLKERFPKASVLVLERGVLPGGASTKNVGFFSVGTFSEILSDAQSLGLESTLEITAKRKTGIALLRERLGDSAIGFEPLGGYELILEKDSALLPQLPEANRWLSEIFPGTVFELRPDLQMKFGFPSESVRALTSAGK
jgi:glycine/D-amino acid oxidase-like deaminating enzyme